MAALQPTQHPVELCAEALLDVIRLWISAFSRRRGDLLPMQHLRQLLSHHMAQLLNVDRIPALRLLQPGPRWAAKPRAFESSSCWA